MSNTPNHLNNPESSPKNPAFTPTDYELRVMGHLGPQIAAWFEDMTVILNEETDPPHTLIRGHIVDQADLYGLISRVRDLGLTLVSVKRLDEAEKGKANDNIENSQSAEDA